jgi:phage recombination protein Bet
MPKKETKTAAPAAPVAEATVLNDADQKQVTVIERVIENREIQAHDAFGKLNRQQIELIKRTYAKGASDDELKLFITVCHGLQLSPFSKQVHLVPRWDSKAGREIRQIQVGIDGFRATAEKTGAYAGNDDPVFEGEKIVEYGEKKQSVTAPEKATVTVWKIVQGQRFAFTATARWSEYYPGAKMGFQWHTKPYLMLGKCAEALALRKGFPTLLSGIYTPEEMDQGKDELNEGERTAKAFAALKNAVSKMGFVELNDYTTKMEKSDKYTAGQKEEFNAIVRDRIAELKKATPVEAKVEAKPEAEAPKETK